ncbi:Quinolinate synthase A [subsurface metagenome]
MENRDAKLIEDILHLKAQRKAVILAHNYQLGEVQDIADFVGDSLQLSQNAAKTDADVIVFCGVHFMAETASILCPDKVVLLPDIHAGCPMADMITAEGLRERKRELPGAIVTPRLRSRQSQMFVAPRLMPSRSLKTWTARRYYLFPTNT